MRRLREGSTSSVRRSSSIKMAYQHALESGSSTLHIPHIISHKYKKKVQLKRRIKKVRDADYEQKKQEKIDDSFIEKNLSMK